MNIFFGWLYIAAGISCFLVGMNAVIEKNKDTGLGFMLICALLPWFDMGMRYLKK